MAHRLTSLQGATHWVHWHAVARREFSRHTAMRPSAIDDRVAIHLDRLLNDSGNWASALDTGDILVFDRIGLMIDDLWDLTIKLKRDDDALFFSRLLVNALFVVLCRSAPDYGPGNTLSCRKHLVRCARRSQNRKLAEHLVAVLRGSTASRALVVGV